MCNQYVLQYFSSTVLNRGLICTGAMGALVSTCNFERKKEVILRNVGKIIRDMEKLYHHSAPAIQKILTRSLRKQC